MKTVFNRKELLKAVNAVGLAAPKRSVLPILQNIIVGVNNNHATLTATDLQTIIKASLNCTSSGITEMRFPATKLKSFLEVVDDCETVSMSLQDEEAILEAGSHEVRFHTNKDDYPPLPAFKATYSTNILNLTNQLKQVSFSMALDESRPVLSAVYFDGNTLITADGFRLSIAPVKIEGKPKGCKLIIPSEAVHKIIKLKMNEVKLEASVSGTTWLARITQGNIELTAMCVLGTFPDYNQLIPENDPNNITVDSKSLLRTIKVMKIANDGYSDCITKLESGKKGLKVWKKLEYNIGIQSSVESKGKLKIALNDAYLYDVLSKCNGEITISSSTVSSPIMIKSNGCTWVIMSMFVEW